MTKLTREGLIDFICSQDPAKLVDDSSFCTCAVGDYARASGVLVPNEPLSSQDVPAFAEFLDKELCTYVKNKAHPLWELLGSERVWDTETGRYKFVQRTYGDLQCKLIETKLVAAPGG